MQVIKTIIFALLSALTGALFLYSAYTKVIPIQTFEYTLVEFVHMPWWMAAFSARLLVGTEAAIGALMVFNVFGRSKWILKLSLLILIMFSIYLAYLWATAGNDVNCGCFGDEIFMSPSSSLLKNAGLILITGILLKWYAGINKKWADIAGIIVFIIITILPYIIFYIPSSQPSYLNEEEYKLNMAAIYESDKHPAPTQNLREGKHILAFMSLTCPHCRMAAYKMQLMKEDNPDISMFMVLNGDSSNLKPFWDETKAEAIPHMMLKGRDFTDMSGFRLPAIYWMNNGWVEARSTYLDLNQAEIEKWMADKSPKDHKSTN